MKNIKKIVLVCLSLIIIFTTADILFDKKTVSAEETAYVSISSGSCEVGEIVNINITLSENVMQCDFYINYDSNIIVPSGGDYDAGGNGILRFVSADKRTFNITFKAINPGTTNISIVKSTAQMGSANEDYMSINASIGKVTVTAPESYSDDNTLSSLEISPGVLSPAFSSNVTTYTTSVGSDCDRLTVSATANDSKATIKVSGTRMDPGLNTTTITVTAEDGSKKVYTIKTTKGDNVTTPEQASKEAEETDGTNQDGTTAGDNNSIIQEPTVRVDDYEYKIISSFAEDSLPSGYVQSETDYNGIKIAVGMGINTRVMLAYLESTDGTGESGFYVYDSVKKTFTRYIEVYQPELSYCVLTIDEASMELPDGYDRGRITINGREIDALLDRTGNYALFYGVSSTGETGWFRYNINDGTIQGYSGYNTLAEPVFNNVPDNALENQNLFGFLKGVSNEILACIAALIVVIVILVVIIIILAHKLTSGKKKLADEMDDYDDSDEYAALINTPKSVSEKESDVLEDEDGDEEYVEEEYVEEDYVEEDYEEYSSDSHSEDTKTVSESLKTVYGTDVETQNQGVIETEELELEEIESEDE